jgi:hypothetical protein
MCLASQDYELLTNKSLCIRRSDKITIDEIELEKIITINDNILEEISIWEDVINTFDVPEKVSESFKNRKKRAMSYLKDLLNLTKAEIKYL